MKRKISENEVSQSFNLKEILGEAAGVSGVADAFAQAAIDKIVSRTESGRDINGKLFAPYSKSYKESLAFNVFGKSSRVNLKLTGDMLASIDIVKSTKSELKIGTNDPDQSVKAYAHITGFAGHPTIKNAKPRDFFGLTESEVQSIKKEFTPSNAKDANKNDEIIDRKSVV